MVSQLFERNENTEKERILYKLVCWVQYVFPVIGYVFGWGSIQIIFSEF